MATEGMHQEAVKCTITCNLQGKNKKKQKNLIKIDTGEGISSNAQKLARPSNQKKKKLVIQQFNTNNNSIRGKY